MQTENNQFKNGYKAPIIIIGGVSGAGKTTIGKMLLLPLSLNFDMNYISATVLRNILFKKNFLSASEIIKTKTAGYNYILKASADTQKIDQAIKKHLSLYNRYYFELIKKSYKQNEGVILTTSFITDNPINRFPLKHQTIILLDCPDDEILHERLRLRMHRRKSEPLKNRDTKKLKYFDQIILARKHLLKNAKKNNIPVVNNFDLNETLKQCIEIIYQDWPHLRRFHYKKYFTDHTDTILEKIQENYF